MCMTLLLSDCVYAHERKPPLHGPYPAGGIGLLLLRRPAGIAPSPREEMLGQHFEGVHLLLVIGDQATLSDSVGHLERMILSLGRWRRLGHPTRLGYQTPLCR